MNNREQAWLYDQGNPGADRYEHGANTVLVRKDKRMTVNQMQQDMNKRFADNAKREQDFEKFNSYEQ